MEQESTLEHETTLEHALDVARKIHKEATRLLDQARVAHAAGEIPDSRIKQLEELLDLATEDLKRVMKEQ
jgi:pyruvate-formate lyase-activating enzyme